MPYDYVNKSVDRMMKYTPEERAYIDFSQRNLDEGTAVHNPDGSVSTVYGTIVNINGRETLIPKVWGGEILETNDAIKKAIESKIQFPTYGTPEEARKREIFLKESAINQQKPRK